MSRTPETPNRYAAEGIPDLEEQTPEQAATGQDEGITEPPHDYPLAVEGFGTTPAEQAEGESLAGRLAREVPEVTPYPSDLPDGKSPEEAAIHVISE
ncbi:MAG: hypothetical protein JWO12_2251 [Frankiales bacterium]|jgi:hypothetical protein|nr:hypothetical protein [Frankiales bacterium]